MINEIVEIIASIHYYFNITTAIILTIIGLIGNPLVLYILTRPKFQKVSIFRYLVVSTIFETFVLLTIWPYNLPNLFQMNTNTFSCKIINYMSYIAYQFCPWIMVLSSADRFLAVRFPTRYKYRNEMRYQAIVLFVIFCLLVLFDIPYYLYYNIYEFGNQTYCGTVDVNIGFYIDLLNFMISTILPFFLMALCTSLIANHIIKQKAKLQRNRKKFKKELQFIKVMFYMDLFFLVCNLPFCIQQLTFDILAINNITYFFWTFIFDLTDFLIFVQCSCGFFVYFGCNTLFRKYFTSMIRFHKERPKYITDVLDTRIELTNKQISRAN